MLQSSINRIRPVSADDILYDELMRFLYEVKILQGIPALNSTLSRHKAIKMFLLKKQISYINDFDTKFLFSDGTPDIEAIEIALEK